MTLSSFVCHGYPSMLCLVLSAHLSKLGIHTIFLDQMGAFPMCWPSNIIMLFVFIPHLFHLQPWSCTSIKADTMAEIMCVLMVPLGMILCKSTLNSKNYVQENFFQLFPSMGHVFKDVLHGNGLLFHYCIRSFTNLTSTLATLL